MMATQLMQVKLVNSRGETMLLPEGLAVQGYPAELEVPGVEIEGKHGMIVDRRLARVKPSSVTVSGSIYGLSKDDADRLRDSIVGFAAAANPVQIYRHEGADTYVLGDLAAVDHAYRTGHFEGRLFTLALRFVAGDPFRHSKDSLDLADDYEANLYYTFGDVLPAEPRWIFPPFMPAADEIYKSVDVWLPQPIRFTLENQGSIEAHPLITITGRVFGGLTKIINPKLTNQTNGQWVQYSGTLLNGQSVIIDAGAFTVTRANRSELANVNSEFLFGGWQLEPGTNEIRIEWDADPLASAKIGLRFEYRERWY